MRVVMSVGYKLGESTKHKNYLLLIVLVKFKANDRNAIIIIFYETML